MKIALSTLVLVAALLLPAMARAQSYSINWYKVAGGGGMNSTGGIYTVQGTIGQHDAVAPISGGGYQVTGGFWAMISVLQTQGAPTLSIRLSGTTVIVYWLAVPGWVLQQNTSLTNTPGWTLSSGVTTSGGTNYLNLVSPTGHLYFRLANP
jgi:hypothetical protein